MPPPRPLRSVPPAASPENEAYPLPPDPQLLEEIELALDDVRADLPPEALAALREDMLAFATGHPAMRELWRRARSRPVPASSGWVPTGE